MGQVVKCCLPNKNVEENSQDDEEKEPLSNGFDMTLKVNQKKFQEL